MNYLKNLRKKTSLALLFLVLLTPLYGLTEADLNGGYWKMIPQDRRYSTFYLNLQPGGDCLWIGERADGTLYQRKEEWYLLPRGREDFPQTLIIQDYMGEFMRFRIEGNGEVLDTGRMLLWAEGQFLEIGEQEFQEILEKASN